MKEFLSQKSIKFAYVDISSNMVNLKSFMKVRDNSENFNEARRVSRVGIPALVVDGEAYMVQADEALAVLVSELGLAE